MTTPAFEESGALRCAVQGNGGAGQSHNPDRSTPKEPAPQPPNSPRGEPERPAEKPLPDLPNPAEVGEDG